MTPDSSPGPRTIAAMPPPREGDGVQGWPSGVTASRVMNWGGPPWKRHRSLPLAVSSSANWPFLPESRNISLSMRMISSRYSLVSGSIYVRSASSGSVMMVAGLEFANTTS